MSLVNDNFLNLYDIKPDFIHQFFSQLEEKFSVSGRREANQCPACLSEEHHHAFDKNGFIYLECQNCSSLYVQNPIHQKAFDEYQKAIVSFIQTQPYYEYMNRIAQDTLFHFELVLNRLFTFKPTSMVQIGYIGYKLDAFRTIEEKYSTLSIEPMDETKQYDLIILNNATEYQPNPHDFFKTIASCLREKGFIYMTARLGSGIDILTLQEQSNIYPIEHRNLFSVSGVQHLLEPYFLIKELTTPGVLDTELIMKSDSQTIPRFMNYIKKTQDKTTLEDFQRFVQKNLLSSYLVLVAQRKLL